jgi:hypothetical protein
MKAVPYNLPVIVDENGVAEDKPHSTAADPKGLLRWRFRPQLWFPLLPSKNSLLAQEIPCSLEKIPCSPS